MCAQIILKPPKKNKMSTSFKFSSRFVLLHLLMGRRQSESRCDEMEGEVLRFNRKVRSKDLKVCVEKHFSLPLTANF